MNYMLRTCATILFLNTFSVLHPMMMLRRVADAMKDEKNKACLKPVILFHRIWSIKEGLAYLKYGISKISSDVWEIKELNKGITFEYIDPAEIQEDSVYKGIFSKEGFFGGKNLYVGIYGFQHSTIVGNAKISRSFDLCNKKTMEEEYEKSKMPLSMYLKKEKLRKQLVKNSKKFFTSHKITAEPTLMSSIGYHAEIVLESPIPSHKLVHGKSNKRETINE